MSVSVAHNCVRRSGSRPIGLQMSWVRVVRIEPFRCRSPARPLLPRVWYPSRRRYTVPAAAGSRPLVTQPEREHDGAASHRTPYSARGGSSRCSREPEPRWCHGAPWLVVQLKLKAEVSLLARTTMNELDTVSRHLVAGLARSSAGVTVVQKLGTRTARLPNFTVARMDGREHKCR